MHRLRLGVAVAIAGVLAGATRVRAQPVRAGAEFQVNTTTTGSQRLPRLAHVAGGGFVAVWTDGEYGGDRNVLGQRYDAAGTRLGGEFQVNTYTTDAQFAALVAAGRKGDFVVVWSSYQGGAYPGLFGQLYDAAGNRRGGEFAVNTYTSGYQIPFDAAFDGSGSFLVVWTGIDGLDGSGAGVRGQRFDAAANRRGAEFQLNAQTAGDQVGASIGMNADGSFVAVWGTPDGSARGVHGQRFSAADVPVGGEFQVNAYTTGDQFVPRLGISGRGDFVVVWREPDGAGDGVFARLFDAAAAPLGAQFQVNTFTTGAQTGASVKMDEAGGFAVAWQSPFDGSVFGVSARRFRADGTPRDSEFVVNAFTSGVQGGGSVSSDDVGNLVVGYTDGTSRDGDLDGVFAQRFGGLRPTALSVDAAGNGVLQPDETAAIRPTWRNLNGGPLTFGGGLTAFGGPAGPTYTLADAAGDYGTVADGGSGACTDCYGVSVSGARPVLHWDATVVETITPDVLGQEKRWVLHVGDSFADVSLSSPFYRFIETLLHRGVTGGCTATSYCPTSGSTREQMAVFVLVAREGAGYAPPACGTPMFGDVPASSPFCKWIEELARRGIVGGCGGGNYCPGAAVTREQMAVFVLRTLDPALSPPACAPPNIFADVPETSPFCKWIEELSRRGIVSGCGGGNYCPTQPVTRQEMGVFISATFGLTLYGP
jgi:hypothetical protein